MLITFDYDTGRTLTLSAYYSNGGTETLRGTGAGTEEPASSGHYKFAAIAGLSAGDSLRIDDSELGLVGSGEYSLAAKAITNKSKQNKSTGVITVYDDDGVTPVLLLTPTDDGEYITLTPSVP